MAGAGREEAAKPSRKLRRESGTEDRLSEKTLDMLPSVAGGLVLLRLPLEWPHPTICGNHLAAAGRLVKVPAFVLMYFLGGALLEMFKGGGTRTGSFFWLTLLF